ISRKRARLSPTPAAEAGTSASGGVSADQGTRGFPAQPATSAAASRAGAAKRRAVACIASFQGRRRSSCVRAPASLSTARRRLHWTLVSLRPKALADEPRMRTLAGGAMNERTGSRWTTDRPRERRARIAVRGTKLLVACGLVGGAAVARAQDIEPRAYSNAPVGVNFLVVGYAYSHGGLSLDPSLPVTDARLESSVALLAYARVLDLWGVSGKFDAIVPYASLSGTADYADQPVQRSIHGLANPLFRVSANLVGAPALTLHEFAAYRQDLIVGVSVEVGVSKAIGSWTIEGQAAVTFYGDNTDFFGGSTRTQDPLYALQGHAIHSFRSGIWASLDLTYFAGGRSTIDGVAKNDLQQNWRVGATLAIPVDRRNSIKLAASSGVSARTGNNFDLLAVAWQYRWGAGL